MKEKKGSLKPSNSFTSYSFLYSLCLSQECLYLLVNILACVTEFLIEYLVRSRETEALHTPNLTVGAVLPLARKEPLQNVLLFMGKLSAALFVTHAFVRQQVLAHDQALPPEISGLLYLLLCIVVAWVYRLCLTCFYKKIHL